MRFDFLKRICYPPDYITMQKTGIEIGNKFIRFVELKNKKGETTLSNFGEILLAPDTIKDGQILNKESLIKSLKEIKGRISSDFVSVSIPEEKTYIFNTQIPKIKNNEIRSALEFKLEENVPLKLEESVFEYESIKTQTANTSDIFLNVSVVPKQISDNFLEAFESAGLKIISFELESKMVSKAVVPNNYSATILVVDIKYNSTILSVVIDGAVRFSSTISVGESNMLDGLRKINRGDIDADKISSQYLDLNNDISSEAFDSLLNMYSILKDEIVKFNEYWLTQVGEGEAHKKDKPRKIIFCGRSSALPGLLNHINQSTGMETVLANVWVNVLDTNKVLPELSFADSLDFASAIGLAMPNKQ